MPKINAAGLALVEGFEGCSLTAYPDPGTGGEPWTIGYGHTGGVHQGETITEFQAEALLQQDLSSAEETVQNETETTLTPNQFSALVSFQFNTGALPGSPGMDLINQRDFEPAWDNHFCLYIHGGNGEVLDGLVRRRAAEKELFFRTD